MKITTKLVKLEETARAKGQHALAAAAAYLLADENDVDRQINLVGALHELGYLKNSLSPYWAEFRRGSEVEWIERCLARLTSSDHDYWALASLLGCSSSSTIATALDLGFKSGALRFYRRFDQSDVHVNTLYLTAMDWVLHPILEIGFDSADLLIVDVGRARALSLQNEAWAPGEFMGDGFLSISMQAKLPHGAWRSVRTEFQLDKDWLL